MEHATAFKAQLSVRPWIGMRVLALNLKAYPESTGPAGQRLLAAIQSIAPAFAQASVRLVVLPAVQDLALAVRQFHDCPVEVFAQHADAVEPGPKTGWLPLESVKATGLTGVMLNHSEHRLKPRELSLACKRAKVLGLQTLLCAKDSPQTARLAKQCKPTMVAMEPPELIGGKMSVSTARPAAVAGTVRAVRRVNKDTLILVGAGVQNAADVRKSLELGAQGVLLASAFVKSSNPTAFLHELLSAFG